MHCAHTGIPTAFRVISATGRKQVRFLHISAHIVLVSGNYEIRVLLGQKTPILGSFAGEFDAEDLVRRRVACDMPLQILVLTPPVLPSFECGDRPYAVLDLDDAWKALPDNGQFCPVALVLFVSE